MSEAVVAAAFRQAFAQAAESYPSQHEMPPKLQEWWKRLYGVVVDSEAGIGVLRELAELKDRVDQLEKAIVQVGDFAGKIIFCGERVIREAGVEEEA